MKTAEQILSEHTGETGIYLTKGQIRGSDALDAMEEYKNQSSYMPVVNELPTSTGYYLCLVNGYLPYIVMFNFNNKTWYYEGEVTHPNYWMELPPVHGI